MQILTSGSFVNLENQERVDQLIFTARAIADSAVETEGFASSEENNRHLAGEIWAGAEYMTREHERARVQNIFVNNFLDRLREIAPAPTAAAIETPEARKTKTSENSAAEIEVGKDEYLGFVTVAENEGEETAETVAETKAEITLEPERTSNEFAPSEAANSLEREESEIVDASMPETTEIESAEPQKVETAVEPSSAATENETDETSPAIEQSGKPAIETITLAEKEPYRFDDCTVTATIQLLPAADGIRKTVVSVKTHDFAPQISVVEIAGEATPDRIAPALFQAFERYKTDLPVKVMDKMRREKSANKRQAAKPATETKPSAAAAAKSSDAAKPETPPAPQKSEMTATAAAFPTSKPSPPAASPTVAAAKTNAKPAKPQDSAQGNLFGF